MLIRIRRCVLRYVNIFLVYFVGLKLSSNVETAKEVPVYEVSGFPGESVRLPCNITVVEETAKGDNVVLVLWYREDLGTPIYSVDIRGRDFDRAEKWSDENVLNNRAYFDPMSSPATLVIDKVSQSDATVYRCRVDFKYDQTRNSKVNLTIIVPPRKIVIMDEKKVQRTSVVGPYIENAYLKLVCRVFGGKPFPYVNWYQNSQLLNGTTSILIREEDEESYVQSTVVIERLQRSHLHGQLACEGRNSELKPPLVAVVQIDMNFSPLDVRILADEQPLTAQRKYDLVCESTGSRPPAKLTWWKNGSRLERTKDSISSDGNTTTSTLTFIPIKEDKGKHLSCQAENPVIVGGRVLETSWRLQIHYTPEMKIILGTSLQPDAIKEGMDVYFDCIVNAFPPVYKVEWRRNDKPLSHNVQKGVIISNQSLVLQSVTRVQAGNYTCIGFNAEGDDTSEPLYLNVMYAPFCKSNQSRVYGVAKNELANISCEVEANPNDLHFRWRFNNSADSEDLPAKLVNKSGSVISVVSHMPMAEVDYGTLLCFATNKVGRQRVPCVFHIIAAGKPDSVSNCSVNNVSLNSFSVRCVEGFNGGLPQTFIIVVEDYVDGQHSLNMTSSLPAFTVSSLQPGTPYKLLIYSLNAKGSSESYPLEIVTQGKRTSLPPPNSGLGFPAEKQQRSFHVTTAMSIIIGSVISISSVICLIVSVFKIQCTKSSTTSKGNKMYNSNGNSHYSEGRKRFPSPIHDDDGSAIVCTAMNFNVEVDDNNPDIIPQPVLEIERLGEFSRKEQHISTIENRYTTLDRNCIQYNNPSISYSGYCTLRSGIVPLRDLCHINTKTTMIHGDVPYFNSCGATLPKHSWPSYSSSVAAVPNHQCVYQTLPSMSHQQIQTRISVPPTLHERTTSPSNTSLLVNKQESTV